MTHRTLLKLLLLLFLTAGCVDVYYLYTNVIPQVFAEEASPVPHVPILKEPLSLPPPPPVAKPVSVTVPPSGGENPSTEAAPSNDSIITDSAGKIEEVENVAEKEAVGDVANVAKSTSPASGGRPDENATLATEPSDENADNVPTVTTSVQKRATARMLPRVETLRFGPGKVLLWRFEKHILKDVAKLLNKYSNVKVRLIGHADDKESTPMALAEERAKAAKQFLEKYGVNPKLIEIESVGDKRPATKGTAPEDRKKNRRVRVRLYIKDDM